MPSAQEILWFAGRMLPLALTVGCAGSDVITPTTVATLPRSSETPTATVQASATAVATLEAARESLTPTARLIVTPTGTPIIYPTILFDIPPPIINVIPTEKPKQTEVISPKTGIWCVGTSTLWYTQQEKAMLDEIFNPKDYNVQINGFIKDQGVTIGDMEAILNDESVWPKDAPKAICTMFESNSLAQINADHITDPDHEKQAIERLNYITAEVNKILDTYARILTRIYKKYPNAKIIPLISPIRYEKYYATAQTILRANFLEKIGNKFPDVDPIDIDGIIKRMCGDNIQACYQDYSPGPAYVHGNAKVRKEIMRQIKIKIDNMQIQNKPITTPTRIYTSPVYPQ